MCPKGRLCNFRGCARAQTFMVEANRKIDNSSGAAQKATRAGQAELSDYRSAMTEAMKCMSLLVNTTEAIKRRLSEIEKALFCNLLSTLVSGVEQGSCHSDAIGQDQSLLVQTYSHSAYYRCMLTKWKLL